MTALDDAAGRDAAGWHYANAVELLDTAAERLDAQRTLVRGNGEPYVDPRTIADLLAGVMHATMSVACAIRELGVATTRSNAALGALLEQIGDAGVDGDESGGTDG